MSFTELMSSGRGPGVIGMVMALIVLLGFGVLFMFAFDEGFQGGEMSIEAVIRQQDKELETYKARIDTGEKSIALTPVRVAESKDLLRLNRENMVSAENIKTLTQNVEASNAEIAKAVEEFEGYKNEYRALVRGKAKGQTMDTLETVTGTVYKNVNIREVTAVGIQIRHDDGQKRIPFEDLPEAMRDHFQFDPAQKEQAMAQENAHRDEHEAAVAVASDLAEQEMAKQREKNKLEAREKLTREIATKEAQVASLLSEIRGLEDDIERANAEAASARASGRMHINKSGSIRSNMRSKQNRASALQAEVNMMKSRL